MPTSVPMPTKANGDIFTPAMWNNNLRDNINKLLNTGHRVLTVAQFGALAAPEGTKGTVAPDEAYVEVDATNGIVWHVHFESTDGSSSKWRVIGGPPLWSEVTTSETTTSATYAALATAGPSIAIPRLCDGDLETGAIISSTANGQRSRVSYDIGGTGAVDADNIQLAQVPATNGLEASLARKRRKTGLTAVTLTMKYRGDAAANSTFSNRYMAFGPTRIG